MGVSLYTSRVVLNVLGASDYGAYSVIGGVVTLFAFFKMAMSTSTQRFLSFELGTGNEKSLRNIFNASVNIHVGIALIMLLLCETIGIWFVENKLKIDPSRIDAARWVFHFTILSFMVTVIQVPYNALMIARERMNVFAVFSIFEVLLKLFIVFLLSLSPYDKLKTFAVLTFVVTLLIALLYRVYCLKHFPESKYLYYFDKASYKKLISFSGWNLFGNLAAVARGQGSNIILNIFFGTVVNAAYGITAQLSGAVKHFVTNFQIAVNPQIIKTYAQGNFTVNHKLILQSSRLSYFLLFVIVAPIWFNVDFILNLWLANPPPLTSIFVRLALINILVDSLSGPVMTGIQASGNIKWYQIIVGLFICIDLPLTYFVLKQYNDPVYSYYTSISINLLSLFLRLYFLKLRVGISMLAYIKEVVLKVLFVTLIAMSFTRYALQIITVENDWMYFMTNISLVTAITGLVIFLIGLSKTEIDFIKGVLRRK